MLRRLLAAALLLALPSSALAQSHYYQGHATTTNGKPAAATDLSNASLPAALNNLFVPASGNTLSFINPVTTPLTFTTPQVQHVYSNQFGSRTFLTLYSQLQTLTLFNASEGVLSVPAGSTIAQANAVAGIVDNAAASATCTNGGGTCAVAGFFEGIGHANGSKTWGINTLLWDDNSRTPNGWTSETITNEFDYEVYNAGTNVLGIQINGTFHAAPGSTSAVIVNGDATQTNQWSQSFVSQNGASPIAFEAGLTGFTTIANQNSQQLRLLWGDSGGTLRGATITAQPDGTQGFMAFANSVAGVIENLLVINGGGLFAVNNAGTGYDGLVNVTAGSDNVVVGQGASTVHLADNGSNTYAQVTPATNTVTVAAGNAGGGNKNLSLQALGTGAVLIGTGTSGNEFEVLDIGASAVNQVYVKGSIVSSAVVIGSTGSDTSISINLTPKGSGATVPVGLFNLASLGGAGAASKYVCVDSSGNTLTQSAAC